MGALGGLALLTLLLALFSAAKLAAGECNDFVVRAGDAGSASLAWPRAKLGAVIRLPATMAGARVRLAVARGGRGVVALPFRLLSILADLQSMAMVGMVCSLLLPHAP